MRKVLIIDDDESILDAVSLILEEEGYEVAATLKGEEAIQKVGKFKPEVILLDMLLSGNDGRHICKKLKSAAATKAIPIIMISAHPNAEPGALEAGAEDFLAKPFDSQDLLGKIEKYL